MQIVQFDAARHQPDNFSVKNQERPLEVQTQEGKLLNRIKFVCGLGSPKRGAKKIKFVPFTPKKKKET